MNKKYIDFVPTKPKAKAKVAKKASQKKAVLVRPSEPKQKEIVREELVVMEDALSVGADTFSLKKGPVYGEIEDFRPKFVKTEVEKRPLSKGHFTKKKSELKEAKSEKISAKKLKNIVEKPVEKSKNTPEDTAKMKIPKSPFINQNKVVKRPLSKNVYERTIKPTEEVQSGPVTIISKPEKDTKVSLIVTIILTIILGAAAGTIAFLLLPK